MPINISLEGYDEKDIVDRVVNGIRHDILTQKKYWGVITEEGHYSDFDKFKNQIAKLVAEKIYQDMINSDEVSKHVKTACEKAEKIISGRINKAVKNLVFNR